MSQDGAEMGRDAPRWAEMGRDAPRCAEMCPTARCALETTSASQMLILSSCHAPGASVLSTWTSVASKIAQHSSWSGTEIASSSSGMAGYLALLSGGSIVHGSLGAAAPDLSLMSSFVSKKNASHCANHAAPSGIGDA